MTAVDRVRLALAFAFALPAALVLMGCDACGSSAPPAAQRSADPGSKAAPMVQAIPRTGVPGMQFVIDASTSDASAR